MTPTRIPADNGADFVITTNGYQTVLSRNSKSGRYNSIGMTNTELIRVCDALIDALEQRQGTN